MVSRFTLDMGKSLEIHFSIFSPEARLSTDRHDRILY